MKNWEFYEEELKKYSLHFAMTNNKLCSCAELPCQECAFYRGEACLCDGARIRFLYQEHKELVVLTDDEKALCKLLGRGWLARDRDGKLLWFNIKPTEKTSLKWIVKSLDLYFYAIITKVFPQCKFDFIKWEDEEPWEVKVDD